MAAPPEGRGAHQMALALFDDFYPLGESIENAPQEVGFRRNNIFIDIVDLSLTARRAIDVAYFIVADDPSPNNFYEVDLNFFKWLMHYTSNNRSHLRNVLREGQKAAIQVSDLENTGSDDATQDRWVSVPLLGPVGISNGKLYFEVHEKLTGHIKNPQTYHFLSLRFVFKSLHAKIIYDFIQPHIEAGVTPWMDLATVKEKLDCNNKTYSDFKYFRRGVLSKAIAHINEVSNLEIDYDTQNEPGWKRIAAIRFRIKKVSEVDAGKAALLLLKSQYDILTEEFGLGKEEMKTVLEGRAEWSDDQIQKAIDYTRFALAKKTVKHRTAGYFMKALKEGYSVGTQDWIVFENQKQEELRKQQEELASKQAATAHEEKLSSTQLAANQEIEVNAKAGLESFIELDTAEKERQINLFSKSIEASIPLKREGLDAADLNEGLIFENKVVRLAFGNYMYRMRNRS